MQDIYEPVIVTYSRAAEEAAQAGRPVNIYVDGPKSPLDDGYREMRKESITAWKPPQLDDVTAFHEDNVEDMIFNMFKDGNNMALRHHGLRKDDRRLKETLHLFHQADHHRTVGSDAHGLQTLFLDREEFTNCVTPSLVLIVKALQNQLIIPDFQQFCKQIGEIYEHCKPVTGGQPAQYIPQLARVSPHFWAISICTVDGQRFTWGDSKVPFCFQSVCKAFNYAIALGEYGADYVHQHVGQEPSGREFNQIALDHNSKPHNPMINAGAIAVSSLLKPSEAMADRFDFVMEKFKKFAGQEHVGFSNQTEDAKEDQEDSSFLSERDTADRNFALAYYLQENKVFPPEAKLTDTLDLYFQLCSMEVTCDSLSVMAATLANGGICPMTGERVVSNRACRDTLSLMYSCGMYDYSGQFAFHVGLPAKSGVSGDMCVVIPNQMGIALWSPALDHNGNSVRGVEFCKQLVQRFNFHNYDSVLNADSLKVDPTKQLNELQGERVVHILFAAQTGDLNALKQYYIQGLDMEMQDYDGRTALHVAASEGHLNILKFLRDIAKVDPSPTDRWDRTPLDDAKIFKMVQCEQFLAEWCQPAAM